VSSQYAKMVHSKPTTAERLCTKQNQMEPDYQICTFTFSDQINLVHILGSQSFTVLDATIAAMIPSVRSLSRDSDQHDARYLGSSLSSGW